MLTVKKSVDFFFIYSLTFVTAKKADVDACKCYEHDIN